MEQSIIILNHELRLKYELQSKDCAKKAGAHDVQ